MSIARITGPMLQANLERLGTDLSIDSTAYFDVNNARLGINNSSPQYTLDIHGNAHLGNIYVLGNAITTDSGLKLNLGNVANVTVSGGSANYVMITDGVGNLSFVDVGQLPSITSGFGSMSGNTIPLGANTVPSLVSNAVTLTTSTTVTNAISELNYVLGKLVPPSPPNFPNATSISISTGTTSGQMTNFVQSDNSGWGNLSVSPGTSVSAVRSATFTTTAVTNVGPGNNGTVTAYVNGTPNGNVILTGSNSNTANGNLYVYNVEDYHAVVSTVAAGFWSVFSTYATGSAGVPAGWNRVHITDTGTATSTNDAIWYYDASTTGTPAFANTSVTLTSNNVTYSSTIPHFNNSTVFRLKGNVNNLSGDLYLTSPFVTSAGGAFATPTAMTYSSFSPAIATPLSRNYTATSYFETNTNITSGFGSSTAGPTVSFSNPYATGSSGSIAPGATVLYKTGTGNQIEETGLTNNFSGNPSTYRIVNPDLGTQSDNPAYTGTESNFNSTTGAFYATDATVVAAVLRYDTNNYSSGYLPVGPNLSTRSTTAQYFTFKFAQTAISKFNIAYTGTIAGLWVALPGVTDASYATPTNGWLNMAVSYSGSGVPGTGAGGNGSTGCSTGGTAVLNSLANGSYTCTFGTQSSTNSTNHEIYVRVKLTAGQSLTALSIQAATN